MQSRSVQSDRQRERAMRAFTAWRGLDGALERASAIQALPCVEWKGRTLYTLRCLGGSGKGPHEQNVPESLLWSLISLNYWRCPFHA